MKGVGILLLVVGAIWALVAFNMDTTVTSEAQRYGSGEFAFEVPSVTVNNLGLMETRRNHLMFSGLTMLAGVVLIGFGSISRKAEPDAAGLVPCPFCAERILPAARKCRYCSSELPEDFGSAGLTPPLSAEFAGLEQQFALIREGRASIETYTYVISQLGGSLTSKGFVDMHYVIELGGVTSRVDRFEGLQQWFLDNILSRVSA